MKQNETQIANTYLDIDLVYLWVDGSDPAWRAKRNAFIGKAQDNSPENCKGRTADNDELKYSLRSVEMYAPWIRKIFIVTDEQMPEWLDTSNPQVRVVDLKEIMPPHCLPCFNSSLIEKFIYKIPGLAEKFIYANDDMFINRPVTPDTFFASDGFPIIRANPNWLRTKFLAFKEKVFGIPMKNYVRIIQNAALLVKQKYGIYYKWKTHHNIDAYLKSSYRHAEEIFEQEIAATITNHVRSDNDIQRNLHSYVALAEKQAHLQHVTQKTSFRLQIHRDDHYRKLEEYNPLFFCMNDSEYADDEDRLKVKEFLAGRFPEKSGFEK